MDKDYKLGVIYGLGAYLMWGVLPIYWKLLHEVPALEILASRFIWSAVFVGLLLCLMGKLQMFIEETKGVFSTWKTGLTMLAAAITISFNWGIFIWAVEDGRIVETSMGYYINPLVSVLFGMLFLGERLNKMQVIAVICACIGIGVMIVKNGSLPWVSVSLAATFAFYGLLKKIIKVNALTSIMLETLILSPIAIGYLLHLSSNGGNSYEISGAGTIALMMGAGAVTATPLIFFTNCAKLLPLKMVGFMQYLAPTISLLIGVFMYGEAFTFTHAIAFGCIWTGLAFFICSQLQTK